MSVPKGRFREQAQYASYRTAGPAQAIADGHPGWIVVELPGGRFSCGRPDVFVLDEPDPVEQRAGRIEDEHRDVPDPIDTLLATIEDDPGHARSAIATGLVALAKETGRDLQDVANDLTEDALALAVDLDEAQDQPPACTTCGKPATHYVAFLASDDELPLKVSSVNGRGYASPSCATCDPGIAIPGQVALRSEGIR